MMDRLPCASCGAPLPEAPGTREVACQFCRKTQPHPRPFRDGQEVLLPSFFEGKLDLARVVGCDGPDRITCEVVGKGKRQTLPIEQLLPVCPPDRVEPHTQIFYRTNVAWEPTWVAGVSGDAIRVKMPDPSFQDEIFDKTVDVRQVRVHLDPARRRTRDAATARRERWRSDPSGLFFKLLPIAIGLFVFAVVAVVLYRELLR